MNQKPALPLIWIPRPERIAKRIARAGICSRRDAEARIRDGRVAVNGEIIDSPALNVSQVTLLALITNSFLNANPHGYGAITNRAAWWSARVMKKSGNHL